MSNDNVPAHIQELKIDSKALGALAVGTLAMGAPAIGAVPETEYFNRPTSLDRAINRFFGFLIGLGLGLAPQLSASSAGPKERANLLDSGESAYSRRQAIRGRRRGYTQWVRNAIATGTVSLKKGRRSEQFGIRLLSDDEKPEILKSYLNRYKLTVQRYFPVSAGSPTGAFRPFSRRYPVFELSPQDESSGGSRLAVS